MPQRPPNIDEIYLSALELPEGSARSAYLDNACRANVELRQRVERLLQAQPHVEGFLESAAGPNLASLAPTVTEPNLLEKPGSLIGPYKLLEQIGEGGFGIVFMAEQLHPVRRKVALKVLKPGMDTRQVIARFEAERQALALMDHPHIARVLDAGATGSGRPYFVMELVRGVSITEYCDANRLTPRERLELFVAVCQAVQHAHQKGIIHRDIKPSNVLVTKHDGVPVVKVIDFGVAKALGQQLTDKTLFTGFAQMIGTPLYMSPEQAELSSLDLDTRTDVYSLGVLLYELLTGTTPFNKERLRYAAFDEIRRIIREEEPPKPSTRLSDLSSRAPANDLVARAVSKEGTRRVAAMSLATVATQRKMEPRKLTQFVRGELDWIVMKALEKDRNRRYETASAFASDVQRYLRHEPVEACPPSAAYRYRKFARRNRTSLLTAGFFGTAMLVAMSAVGWAIRDRSAQRVETERERVAARLKLEERVIQALAEAQAEFERDNLPKAVNASNRAEGLLASDNGVSDELRRRAEQWGQELKVLQRLEGIVVSAISRSARELDDEFSQVFLDMGIDIDGEPIEQAGKRIRSRLTWQRVTEALDWWVGARQALNTAENSSDAVALGQQRLLQVATAADPDELRSRARRAVGKSDLDEARKLADSPAATYLPASLLRRLAKVVFSSGEEHDRERAKRLLDKALLQRPGDFPLNVACAQQYARTNPPEWNEAARHWSIALALRPSDVNVCIELALTLFAWGKRDQALEYFSRAIELDPKSRRAWTNRAEIYEKLGFNDKAIADFTQVIELDPSDWGRWDDRGMLYLRTRALEKALADFTQSLTLHSQAAWVWEHRGSANQQLECWPAAVSDYSKAVELNPKNAWCWYQCGVLHAKLGQFETAVVDDSKALELEPKSARLWSHRGWVQRQLGLYDKALVDFSMAIELDPNTISARVNRGETHIKLGHYDKALADFSAGLEVNPDLVEAWRNRGVVYCMLHQWDDALAAYSKAIELDPARWGFWDDRGMIYWNMHLLENALADFSQALALHSEAVHVWEHRAGVYQELGRWKEAFADRTRAFELAPESRDTMNGLAWLLAICPDSEFHDSARAVELATSSMERDPEYWAVWNTLGVAQYRARNWTAAIEALNKSVGFRNGGDSSDWFFLAMSYWQLGDTIAAHRWYDKAVQWMDKNQPENEELKLFRAEAGQLIK